MRKVVLLLLFVGHTSSAVCQENENAQTISAGIQFRPIFPMAFLKTGDRQTQNDEYNVLVRPKFGYAAGMVIRYGFHRRFALETGLNFIQRNYDLSIERDSISGTPTYLSNTDFTIVGYEHPIKFLVFVRLAEKLYMNAAAGLQLTFFPSDIFTTDKESSPTDQYFKHSALRLGFNGQTSGAGFVSGGAIANIGWEYGTKKAGSFYLGATYHVAFAPIYSSKFQYLEDGHESLVQAINLNGSYLTFDISYFFHSKPIVKKERKKKVRKKPKEAPTSE